ncbi:MAG TPA: glycosyltransferase family 4 protein [Xanthobacteraceae bacterium]|jgi:UDP-glucose:(heptosyl)LPS alpha-1,3-glucosyltransferase
MNAANMPHPPDGVQSRASPRGVLFIRQQFTPFGGGELVLDRIISAMTAHGVRVSLLGRAWTGRKDIEFLRCDPPRFPRFSRERRFARLACEIIARRADVLVQSHERLRCCDIFRAGDGVHAAFLEQRMRGLGWLSRRSLALHPFHRTALALEREMFSSPRLKVVLANSSMVADEIVRHFGFPRERIHLVPNGIDLGRFDTAARDRHRKVVRNAIGTQDARPVALFVGSGYKRKGLDAAIAALATSGIDAELWIVGSDSRPGTYVASAQRAGIPADRLRMIGPQADPLPYYAAADVLILPSIYDPFPSTVLEALACGLPVVTSTACGAREIVARLDRGLVRDATDVAGLAEALRLAFELAARPAIAAEARAIANDYSIDQMIDRMLSVYAALGVGSYK